MKIVRSILGVVFGLVASMVAIMAVHRLSMVFYPLPEGVDPNNAEQLKEVLPKMPTEALLLVVAAWESGAFVGGALAALIAGWARCVHAGVIGALVLAATIANFRMLPGVHPEWMIVAGLLLPLPTSLLAGKIVSLLLPHPPAPQPQPPVDQA
jgi:hypothetical protein